MSTLPGVRELVEVTVALPTGTNNIGDVDVATAPATAADAAAALPAVLSVVAGFDGTNVRRLRTATDGTLRSDPTGTTAQPVTDAGGSLTMDAPVGTPVAVRVTNDAVGFATVATDRATAASPFSNRLSDGAAFYDAAKTGQLPAALVGGRLDMNLGASSATVTAKDAGMDAIHATFTNAALAAGASDQTAYTVTAGKVMRVTSILARYTGTVTGVTLQAKVGGQEVAVVAESLTTAKWVQLLASGQEVWADPTETVVVAVAGATLNDTLDAKVHGLELTQ